MARSATLVNRRLATFAQAIASTNADDPKHEQQDGLRLTPVRGSPASTLLQDDLSALELLALPVGANAAPQGWIFHFADQGGEWHVDEALGLLARHPGLKTREDVEPVVVAGGKP